MPHISAFWAHHVPFLLCTLSLWRVLARMSSRDVTYKWRVPAFYFVPVGCDSAVYVAHAVMDCYSYGLFAA